MGPAGCEEHGVVAVTHPAALQYFGREVDDGGAATRLVEEREPQREREGATLVPAK